MMKRFITSMLLLTALLSVKAQVIEHNYFTNDPSITNSFDRLADSIKTGSDPLNVSDVKLSFSKFISDRRLTDNERSDVCKVLNAFMLQSQPLTIYSEYITAANNFLTSDFSSGDFATWSNYLTSIKTDVAGLTRWSQLFALKQLYGNNILTWEYEGGTVKITTEKDEPVVVISNSIVRCTLNDSIIIKECSGKYYPDRKVLIGEKGTVTWEKAGMPESDIYARLSKPYSIDMNKNSISMDSVSLYYKKYFGNTPLLGSFSDRCVNRESKEANYPKFAAYNDNIIIRNLYPDVDFTGQILLEGNRMSGSGTKDIPAQVNFIIDRKPTIFLKSEHFLFSQKYFSTKDAEMEVYIKDDTIHQPSCLVRYDVGQKRFRVTRDDDKSGSSPFHSTYHKMNIYSDELIWCLNSDSIFFAPEVTFTKGGTAFFESDNYFSEERFRQFETPDGINMLITINKYVREYSDSFYLDEISNYCKISHDQVKALLLILEDFGLVSYDNKNDHIVVLPKLYRYIANKSKRQDYDILSIHSQVTNDYNAILDKKTLNLRIYGVDKLVLSEKKNVIIYPYYKTLDVSANMDFHFSGYVKSGLIDIYSTDNYFNYSEFKVKMPQIDSLSFYYNTGSYDIAGHPVISKISSPIENLKGYLEIDKFYNKSGVIDNNKEYPRFWSTDSAFVYYQRPEICDNVYQKDKFFFLIDPFMFDSLATFIPDNISFSGEFVSAGIFNNFRENLMVMEDKSLGFRHNIPEEGYPAYSGKCNMKGIISLSNECLQINGSLKYLSAELHSEHFMMYPETLYAVVDNVVIEEKYNQTEFPYIAGEQSEMSFDIPNDRMEFTSTSNKPYKLYHDQFILYGKLYFSEEGITGKGKVRNGLGEISSNMFSFDKESFTADSSDFAYYQTNDRYTIVNANDYSMFMDINHSEGEFAARNAESSKIVFKENGYSTNYQTFLWDLSDKRLILGDSSKERRPSNIEDAFNTIDDISHAYAMSKSSDSLNFGTSHGNFDYSKMMLTFNGVNYIESSDAAIIPADGTVTATVGGALMPITNGYVVLNLGEHYHVIHQLSATIKSRKEFSGSGYYNYVDSKGNSTPVFVEKISGKDSIVTCRAIISELNPLPLNPIVDFQGTITIKSPTSDLLFNGYYHIKQPCFEDNTWLKLATGTDPDNLQLPVNRNIVSLDKKPVYSGINLSKPGAIVYPSFLSTMKKTSDWSIFNVDGLMAVKDNEFSIVDTSSTFEDVKNKHISLNIEQCAMHGFGEYNFLENPGRITLKAGGSLNYHFVNDSLISEVALALDFHFNKSALDIMYNELAFSYENTSSDNGNTFLSTLRCMMSKEEFEEYYNSIEYGNSEMPGILKSNIVLSRVKLIWDNNRKVFYSTGPIDVYSINGNIVDKTVEGVVEISKASGTESISIILITKGEYGISDKYFFFYHNNNMFTYSTNDDFSNKIRNDSSKVRRLKREDGLPAYQYIIATSERFAGFCNDYGIK